ncbi:MAG: D-alanine--D-alanine ligase [Parcubacteria group bacterium]|nr:D-alanine--D-alanine ligase [Parcubacteria group bacterium]|tara:strand:+ start:1497 stop:2489 length:993 start_codon:yes stop_codon:yes gene_type:complete
MSRINVGVLRGGPSSEYDVSLASGNAVLQHLSEERYNTRDILISKDGQWNSRGIPLSPERALRGIDVAFIALHGEYGEDGQIQKILDAYNIPYTGSGVFGSSVAMDKGSARKHVGNIAGVKMPCYFVLHREDVTGTLAEAAQKVFSQFGPLYIVKPLRGGSSVGIATADSVSSLVGALKDVFAVTDAVIVEQFIKGREGACGVIDDFREESLYTLPPVEIIVPNGKGLFDYESKYDGLTEEVCPANFSAAEKALMQKAAREVHKSLGLNHYSRSDFIIAPSGIYFLEVNTLPGLTPSSLLPKSLEAVGVEFPDFLDHLLTLSLKSHGHTR